MRPLPAGITVCSLRIRSTLTITVTAVCLGALAPAASAALRPAGSVRIAGAAPGSLLGWSVAAAGDVNGDGIPDVIMGAPQRKTALGQLTGGAYVVFGSRSRDAVDLGRLSSRGFEIAASASSCPGPCITTGLYDGATVAAAGDVNRDGLSDVMLGNPTLQTVTIVFGKRDSAPVDLSALGRGGYVITGGGVDIGFSLAPAGDFNGDRNPDQVFGMDIAGDEGAQGAFVLYGSAALAGQRNEFDALIRRGLGVDLGNAGGSLMTGEAVASASDVNRDGLGDVLVGAPGSGAGDPEYAQAGVLFGGLGTAGFPTGPPPPGHTSFPRSPTGPFQGLKLVGESKSDRTGAAVGGGCDVNGDHIPDVVIGAPLEDHGLVDSGSVYVVYGRQRPGTIQLRALGNRGFRIDGVRRRGHTGAAVALIRTRKRSPPCLVLVENGPSSRGPVYALTPRPPGSVTRLRPLGRRDVFFTGVRRATGFFLGAVRSGAAGAGDFNGDGREDVVVGDPATGRVLVLLAPRLPRQSQTARP